MDSNLMTMGVKGSGNYFQRAAQVVETIENFMHSPDEHIEMEHVPNRWSSKSDGGGITIPPIQRYVFDRGSPKKSRGCLKKSGQVFPFLVLLAIIGS